MRKMFVVLAVAVALLATGIGLALTSVAPSGATTLGASSPNFACIALGNIGICIGPPTKQV